VCPVAFSVQLKAGSAAILTVCSSVSSAVVTMSACRSVLGRDVVRQRAEMNALVYYEWLLTTCIQDVVPVV